MYVGTGNRELSTGGEGVGVGGGVVQRNPRPDPAGHCIRSRATGDQLPKSQKKDVHRPWTVCPRDGQMANTPCRIQNNESRFDNQRWREIY